MARVAVGLSGGVDSSVTAALMLEAGHEVIALSMRLYDAPEKSGKSCCSPDDLFDARHVADMLGIPFYVLNFTEIFRQTVIEPWAEGYRAGRTPNPCIRCNAIVKFRALTARADALGAAALATGHFAKVEEVAGRWRLGRSLSREKDQSYFLYPVPVERLPKFWLPLASMTKQEVRARADVLGLPTAAKSESQDACFVTPNPPHVVVRRITGKDPGAGRLVDENGRVLGQHKGFDAYTVGQRRGLGMPGGPWYVVAVSPERNEVVVRHGAVATTQRVEIDEVHWHIDEQAAQVGVKLRSRGEPVPATLTPLSGGRAVFEFDEPVGKPAPGQVAVAYDDKDWVVCGGVITG
jgi:tRNA-specific 2-thiouridylase